jgi:ribosome-associated translation inhibitor RaiA
MQIQINSDHNIATPEGFAEYVRKVVDHALRHCQDQVTRIEVHFSDESAGKSGADDKRCVMEARLANRDPIAVSDQASTLNDVIDGAAEKLRHALVSILGKEHDHHPNK